MRVRSGVLVLIGGSSLIAARYLRGDDLHEETASSSFVDYKKGMKTTKKEKKKQVEKNKKQSATAEYIVTSSDPVVTSSTPVVRTTRDDDSSLCGGSGGQGSSVSTVTTTHHSRSRRFFGTDTELLKFRRLLRRARSYTLSIWDEQELRRLQRSLQARVDSGDLRRVDVVKLNDWLNLTDYQYNHYRIRPRSSWTWWR